MKVLGWIFLVLIIFCAGFLACHFGLIDKIIAFFMK